MKKMCEKREVRSYMVTSYKQNYVLDEEKGIYGKGMAAVAEGELVMNVFIWHKGDRVSPQDKLKVSIEWLKDLTKALEQERKLEETK